MNVYTPALFISKYDSLIYWLLTKLKFIYKLVWSRLHDQWSAEVNSTSYSKKNQYNAESLTKIIAKHNRGISGTWPLDFFANVRIYCNDSFSNFFKYMKANTLSTHTPYTCTRAGTHTSTYATYTHMHTRHSHMHTHTRTRTRTHTHTHTNTHMHASTHALLHVCSIHTQTHIFVQTHSKPREWAYKTKFSALTRIWTGTSWLAVKHLNC